MRTAKEEFRAVFGKGWALLGGALPTVVGLILGAARVVSLSAYWFISLLLGVIVAEALVIADRRKELDALRVRLDSVRSRLSLDNVQTRYERISNGPPTIHRMEFRLVFGNTADLPLQWEISDVQAVGQTVDTYRGLGHGVVAPGRFFNYTLTVDVIGATPEQVPPKVVDVKYTMVYGVGERRFSWTFAIAVHEFPAAPAREWTDATYLHLDDECADLVAG